MSSTRQLRPEVPEPFRTIELLDWETRPEDFDRLCEFIIGLFAERDHVARERLFKILPEEDFRRELRQCAESFTERSRSLVMYVYLRMKLLVLPEAVRQKRVDDDVA
jgi:hypothetical protein